MRQFWEQESAAVPAESVGLAQSGGKISNQFYPTFYVKRGSSSITTRHRIACTTRKMSRPPSLLSAAILLSRGLTLEGLVCSYFVRAASAYDTLLQMGRWFGYRRGYEDLPRIWMPEELAGWFQDLATVEEEIRRDIRAYGPKPHAARSRSDDSGAPIHGYHVSREDARSCRRSY